MTRHCTKDGFSFFIDLLDGLIDFARVMKIKSVQHYYSNSKKIRSSAFSDTETERNETLGKN